MVKDDYYVIVGKILVYLYARFKDIEKKEPSGYLIPMSKEFPISKDYFNRAVAEMEKHGYIEVNITRAWGGDIVSVDIDNMVITQEGIDYLRENSGIRKALELIPMAAKVFELFQ